MPDSKERSKVRAERVDTKCGSIGHMTVDEIRGRTIGNEVEMTCPECGEIHLTEEDACEAAQKKISETAKYKKIKSEAEAD
ncbi:MAG: hypothetical protein V1806_12040 [Pseudomonadota bacterium]